MQHYSRAAKIYATAFFDFALENGLLKEISEQVLKLQTALEKNSDIISLLAAPIYSQHEQQQIINSITEELKLSKEMCNLFAILARNKRISSIIEILEIYNHLNDINKGYKFVEVTVSEEIDLKQKKKIQEKVEEILSSKAKLSFKLNQHIIGGIIIKINDKMFDASVRGKFNQFADIMQKEIALL
jgi:F-type H+-transporting ATPase subunit delta